MGKLKLSALLLGAVLFLSLGTTSLMAESKCGASSKSEKICDENCIKNCEKGVKCTHGDKCDCKNQKSTSAMKCDSGKCGNDKKSASMMKCGAGKCGSN